MNMTDTSTYPVYISLDWLHPRHIEVRDWLHGQLGPHDEKWTVKPDSNISRLVIIFLSESDRTRFILTWGVG